MLRSLETKGALTDRSPIRPSTGGAPALSGSGCFSALLFICVQSASMSAVLEPRPARVDLQSPAAAQAALRTFWRVADAWKLSVNEQLALLGLARTTLYQWKQGKVGPLDRHVLERLSYVFGIYAALQVLLPLPKRAHEWIRKPNSAPLFGGRSALERMMAGQVADLFVVRQYLDAELGGKA